MEEADWDLLAVVRGCTSTATAGIEQHAPPPPASEGGHGGISPSGFEDLQDLYKPFLTQDLKRPIDGGFYEEEPKQRKQHPQQILFQQHPQQQQQQEKESQVIFGTRASTTTSSSSTSVGYLFSVGSIITSDHTQRNNLLCAPTTSSSNTPQTQQRSKKRKNLQKRVCHVPAEGLSSDMWAWRKYGQKPIKGSPYPRGYYRCSSSKGCLARKQVERNRSDPKMFIVTYTSEHNHPMPTHRNSLAGSTRSKPAAAASPGSAEKGREIKGECEEEILGKENIDDSGDEMEIKDMVMNDDFFVGFEELDDSDGGDLFPDQVRGNLEMGCPWMGNTSSSSSTTTTTTTAAGGS